MIDSLEQTAVPELVPEFAATLTTFWRLNRDTYTTEAIPSDMLYMLLDSFTSVVLPDEAS